MADDAEPAPDEVADHDARRGSRPGAATDRSVPGSPAPGTPAGWKDHSPRIRELVELIRTIEAGIPEPYRLEVFRTLVTGESGRPAPARTAPPMRDPELPSYGSAASPDKARIDLSSYTAVLAAPGRTLLKALAALDAARGQLGVDWMSPSEIERFLVDRARVGHVYRTNISNALRGARPLADRRRRGRGYEYSITLTGQEALEREQKVLGG